MEDYRKYTRKLLHVLSGFVLYFIYIISGNSEFYSFFMFMFGFGIILSYSLGIHKTVKAIHKLLVDLRKKGEFLGESFLYMVSSFIIGSILLDDKWFFVMFWLITISDTVAFLFGQKYGKIKVFGNKTLEGFFGFLVASLPLLLIINPYTIIPIIIASGIIELIESFEDNITIAVFIGILKKMVL